jgi:hypothetical protein
MIFDDEHTHRHSMPPGGHSEVTTDVTGPAPPAAYNGPMNTSRLSHRALAIALAALTAMLVAACGGAKKPPSASLSGRAGAGAGPGAGTAAGARNAGVQAAYRYADCMRTHGVTNFGDPKVSSDGSSSSIGFHVDPAITGSPAFKSAQRTCAHILPRPTGAPTAPQQHAREQAFLAFSRCMREHGFPKFPDPDSQGRLSPAMLSAAGINLQQPAIRPAGYACVSVTHGLITRADINQAIANPNGGSQSASAGG